MTDQARLLTLKTMWSAKFDQICDAIARERGLGVRSSLTQEQISQVVESAEDAIEKWNDSVVEDLKRVPKTPFESLLNEVYEIGEEIQIIEHRERGDYD